MKRYRTRLTAGDARFIMIRGLSVTLALGFALLYSKQLGVERRGLLTLVMTTNLVFSIILISGISLHLRNLTSLIVNKIFVGNYLATIFLFSLFTPLLNMGVLSIYQNIFDINLSENLIYATIIYCFFSTFNFGMHDALLLVKQVKLVAFMDISVIVLQILAYWMLVSVGETSYFVSVLISTSLSYLVMVFASLMLIVYIYNPRIKISFSALIKLFSDSSTPLLTTVTTQLLDRIDKLFIGFLLTSGDLGRFSTSQSILGLSRFVPDSLAKLSMVRDKNVVFSKKALKLLLLFSIPGSIILAWIVTMLLRAILGKEWVLPLSILTGLAFIEIVRGVHTLIAMNAVRSFDYKTLRSISIFQLTLGLLIQPMAIYLTGLWGALLSAFIVFIFGVISMRRYAYV